MEINYRHCSATTFSVLIVFIAFIVWLQPNSHTAKSFSIHHQLIANHWPLTIA